MLLSNGLVTPAILGPWIQFSLQGFMAGTATDEALPFKFLTILTHILALWLLLHLLWLLLLAIVLAAAMFNGKPQAGNSRESPVSWEMGGKIWTSRIPKFWEFPEPWKFPKI